MKLFSLRNVKIILLFTIIGGQVIFDLSYIAVLFNYHPESNESRAGSIDHKSSQKYIQLIRQTNADIIFFPDAGIKCMTESKDDCINYVIPEPDDNIVLCGHTSDLYAKFIKELSCSAIDREKYILVNIPEKILCTTPSCSPLGYLLYNSAVLFDPNGKVVFRRRNYDMLNGNFINQYEDVRRSILKTNFGMTFVVFSCIDILLETPTSKLLKHENVTDIVYITNPNANLPLVCTSQVLEAWARLQNVTVIRLGYNGDEIGVGGCGVYNKQISIENENFNGHTIRYMTIMIKTKVPEVRTKSVSYSGLKYNYPRPENASNHGVNVSRQYHASELLEPRKPRHYKVLCNDRFCCKFSIIKSFDESSIRTPDHTFYRYRVIITNDHKPFSYNNNHVEIDVCGVIACTNDTLESCGNRFDHGNVVSAISFRYIQILYEPKTSKGKSQICSLPIILRRDLGSQYSNFNNIRCSLSDLQANSTTPSSCQNLTLYDKWTWCSNIPHSHFKTPISDLILYGVFSGTISNFCHIHMALFIILNIITIYA